VSEIILIIGTMFQSLNLVLMFIAQKNRVDFFALICKLLFTTRRDIIWK
jgi:hypothetical protein